MRFLYTLLLLAAGSLAHAANENDALALAVNDARPLGSGDAILTRYIWVTTADLEDLKAVVLALNYDSQASVLYRPEVIGKDGLMLVRVDLSRLAPVTADGKNVALDELIKIWEEFQFDPVFNQLLTQDTLRFLDIQPTPMVRKRIVESKRTLEKCAPYVQNGQTLTTQYVTRDVARIVEIPFKDQSEIQVLRSTSEHLDPMAMGFLVNALRTQAPIVSHKYFLTRALSTIKDKGLFKTIYGGLYYDLAGIKTAKRKKGSDLDVLLESLGIGNVEGGVGFAKLFDRLRSDQRVAVFRSLVTGKPRRVLLLPTLVGREERGLVIITQDFKDEEIDIGTHPVMNLLDLRAQAQEVIWVLPTGLHGFAAFDGDGKRTDEVPFDVANDSTIPRPHTQRLQPAIGCIRCHGSEGGWRVLANDVQKLVGPGKRLNIFDDLQDRKKSRADVFDRLAGLYAGDVERRLLPNARDDYATAILKAAGPWPKSLKNQTDVHALSAERIGAIYNDYVYGLVDARKALGELGVHVAEKVDPVALMGELLPPVGVAIDGVIPEDPRIEALKKGLGINRSEWDLVRSFVAVRIARGKKQ